MRHGRLIAAAAVAALAVVPAPDARAAGLSAPRTVTPRGGTVDQPLAAIAPNGRTALLWRRIRISRRGVTAVDWVGALGDTPDALGRPVVLPAGRAASDARVVARDD